MAQQALAVFCQNYWLPLYAFLRHRGYPVSDAQDLTQDFFIYLTEQNILSRADRERGRLRTFLLRALQNFVADRFNRARAYKRGGGQQMLPLHEHLVEAEAAFATTGRFDETACYDLDLTQGLVCTEAVMMALAPKPGREKAHDRLSLTCRQVAAGKGKLIDLLADDEEIKKVFDRDQLEKLIDPRRYLGLSGEMVDRVLRSRS